MMKLATTGSGRRHRFAAAVLGIGFMIACGLLPAQDAQQLLNASIDAQARIDDASRKSQVRVAQLADQKSEYLSEYRVATQQLDRLKVYNANLERLVRDQEREKAALQQQLDNFGDIEKGIVPLMYELIGSLKSFVDLDMPFLQVERKGRIERLETNMERADLTVSEKYRQIMEAYQIETSYGRNIETYPGKLNVDGEERKVNMLRIGRILLAYQTPDQSITGYWDKSTRQWVQVDGRFRRAIAQGIRIANKQAAPTLLEIPLPLPETAE